MEYWSIIGRACIDPEFREKVVERAKPKEQDVAELVELWELLCNDYYFRITRWELGDINRVFSVLKMAQDENPPPPSTITKERSPALHETVGAIHQHWDKAMITRQTPGRTGDGYKELCSLIGACCMDGQVRQRYLDAAATANTDGGAAILAETKRAPKFFLNSADHDVLHRFFNGSEIAAHLKTIHDATWIRPRRAGEPGTACAGGTTPKPANENIRSFYYLPSPLMEHIARSFSEVFRAIDAL